MLKIDTRFEPAGPVTLTIAGHFGNEHLGELKRALQRARRSHKEVFIDLSEVTLVDRHSLQFLAAQTRQDIKLINCPEYLEPWISRECAE
jgi:hypothetical protein